MGQVWTSWAGACGLAGLLALGACGGGEGADAALARAAVAAKAAVADPGFSGNGTWWDPAEPGTGFFFEEQGGTGVLALFVFDTAGKPAWYTAVGPVRLGDAGRTVFSGILLRYSGGQTLSAPSPRSPASRTAGAVQVAFDGDTAHVQLAQRAFIARKFNLPAQARPATASQPETGIYWNPAEGGRGYTVEVDGGVASIGFFHYDEAGDPVWRIASGSVETGGFQGPLLTYSGGQALAGPYRAARQQPVSATVTAAFSGPCTGSITLPGLSALPIQRFGFGVPGRECRATPDPSVLRVSTLAGAAVVGDIRLAALSPTSVDADILQGQAMPGVPLSIVLTGEDAAVAGKSFHAMVEDPDSLLASVDKPEVVGGNGRTLVSFLRPRNQSSLGERRGSFRVFVCLDAACTQQLNGSPFALPYRVNVRGLQASKEAIMLNTQPGLQPQTQTFSITLPKGATGLTARMKAAGATVVTDAPPLSTSFPAGYTTTVGIKVALASTTAPGLTTNAVVVTARFQAGAKVDEWVKEIPVYRENFAVPTQDYVPIPASQVQVRLPVGREEGEPLDLRLMTPGSGTAAPSRVQYLGFPRGLEGHPLVQAWLVQQPGLVPGWRVAACNPADLSLARCLPAGRYLARVSYALPSGGDVSQVVMLDLVP